MTGNGEAEYERADSLFRAAVPEAAAAIVTAPSFKEKLVEAALAPALRNRGAEVALTGRNNLKDFPEWKNQMKKWDLEVRPTYGGGLLCVEAKVDDVGETLWDLFKLASAQRFAQSARGYLIVAATRKHWGSDKECCALFAPEPARQVWETRELIRRWEKSWRFLLGPNGHARPVELPERIATRFIAKAPIQAFAGYELRAVAVNRPDDVAVIPMDDEGWPLA